MFEGFFKEGKLGEPKSFLVAIAGVSERFRADLFGSGQKMLPVISKEIQENPGVATEYLVS